MWFRQEKPVVYAPNPVQEVIEDPANPDLGEWISVKEALPEFGVRVLVSDPSRGVLTGYRKSQTGDGDSWTLGAVERISYSTYLHEATSSDITHWRAIPAGPVVKAVKRKPRS